MIAPAIIPDLTAASSGQPANANLKTGPVPVPGGFLSVLQAKTVKVPEAGLPEADMETAEQADLDGALPFLGLWPLPGIPAADGEKPPEVVADGQVPVDALIALSGNNQEPTAATADNPAATIPEASPISTGQENLPPLINLSPDAKPQTMAVPAGYGEEVPGAPTVNPQLADDQVEPPVATASVSKETPGSIQIVAGENLPAEPKNELSAKPVSDSLPPAVAVDPKVSRGAEAVPEQPMPASQSAVAAAKMTAEPETGENVVMTGAVKNPKEDSQPVKPGAERRVVAKEIPLNINAQVPTGDEQAFKVKTAATDPGERTAPQVQTESGKDLTQVKPVGSDQGEILDVKPDSSMLFKLQQALHHAQLSPETEVRSPESVKHVLQQMEVMVRDNLAQATLVLKPEHLGKLTIQMEVHDGVLNAKFVVENQQAREMLETNLAIFRQQLEQSGVRVEKVEVTLNQPGNDGSQFFNQHQYRNPGQEAYQKPESYGTWQPEDRGSSAYLPPDRAVAAVMNDHTWMSSQGVNYVI